MTWTIIVTRPAERAFHSLTQDEAARIRQALQRMKEDPFAGDVRKLKGRTRRFRRRVGAWRILFEIDGPARRVIVAGILRRTSTTY